jgi:hypothetical protein
MSDAGTHPQRMLPVPSDVCIVFLGLIAAATAVAGYLRVLVRGESDPHWVSWLVWSLIGATGTWASYDGGAGRIGVLVPLFFALTTFAIFALSFRRSRAIVTGWDLTLGAIAIATLASWRHWHLSPGYAAIAAVASDACVLYPTLRNVWRDSGCEPLRPWLWSSLASACGLLVLDTYSFASTLYLAYLLVADLAIAAVIVHACGMQSALPRMHARAARRPL